MRYRFMATYRGIPYEAGVGPTDADIMLFAACPPPEELGFQPASGHWRKAVTRAWGTGSAGTVRRSWASSGERSRSRVLK